MDGLLYTLFSDLERSLATTHQVTTTLGIVDGQFKSRLSPSLFKSAGVWTDLFPLCLPQY